MRFLWIFLFVFGVSAGAGAEQRYESWKNPDTPSVTETDKSVEILKDLNKLVDAAERDRAANPRFLQDLRALLQKYGQGPIISGLRVILSDQFKDGDYTARPQWQVTQGQYWVEPGWGLRSAVEAPKEARSVTDNRSDTEKTIAVLNKVLQHAVGVAGSGGTAASAAIIHSSMGVSNQFAIDVDISSWQSVRGAFVIGVYQGAARAGGYRLVYEPLRGFELNRFSGMEERAIARGNKQYKLEDEKSHKVTWVRDKSGWMTIYLDGMEIIKTRDRGYQDPFDGIEIANRGGDYIVRSVVVKGR